VLRGNKPGGRSRKVASPLLRLPDSAYDVDTEGVNYIFQAELEPPSPRGLGAHLPSAGIRLLWVSSAVAPRASPCACEPPAPLSDGWGRRGRWGAVLLHTDLDNIEDNAAPQWEYVAAPPDRSEDTWRYQSFPPSPHTGSPTKAVYETDISEVCVLYNLRGTVPHSSLMHPVLL
jgi:hypothetical protein